MYRCLSKSQKKQMHHSDNQIVIKYNLVFLTKIIVGKFAYIRNFSYLCI